VWGYHRCGMLENTISIWKTDLGGLKDEKDICFFDMRVRAVLFLQ